MARKQTKRERDYFNKVKPLKNAFASDAINSRNNDVNDWDPSADDPNVESANDTGIGDSGMNRDKLTNYTSNHKNDA
jgi:hypothetical protein